MQFIDLAAQQKRIRTKIEANIAKVLDHGKYIMGPEIRELEERLGEYAGVKHVITCSSGTDALLMALMAYNVGPGDAIFTTPFTFIATAEVISILGATPVFIDIDPVTFNLDPAKLVGSSQRLEPTTQRLESTTQRLEPTSQRLEPTSLTPRGIIAVDLFGLPADYNAINNFAKKHNLFVIEDAAQSFGAEYHGRKAGSLADIACTSFFPAKPLGCYGDGGAVLTNQDDLAEKMRSIRVHGQGKDKYDNVRIGINGRMDTFQAAILSAKFDIFPEEVELRQDVAKRYKELLLAQVSDLKQLSLITPSVPQGIKSVWAQYSLLAKNESRRAELQSRLNSAGIPTAIYYPCPLHLQTAFAYMEHKKGDFPISEDCASRIFSIPMHPYLKQDDQEKIAEILIS